MYGAVVAVLKSDSIESDVDADTVGDVNYGFKCCCHVRMSMEMDLMSPFLLRQTAAVSNVHVTVTSLNRVQLDRPAISKV